MLLDQRDEVVATKTAKAQRQDRLDRMAHDIVECALQADKVTGEHEVDDLPAPVIQREETDRHPFEDREEVIAAFLFLQHGVPALETVLANADFPASG